MTNLQLLFYPGTIHTGSLGLVLQTAHATGKNVPLTATAADITTSVTKTPRSAMIVGMVTRADHHVTVVRGSLAATPDQRCVQTNYT